MKKPSKETLQMSNFDLKTTWAHKIMHGATCTYCAYAYAFQKEHNNIYLLGALGILPLFLLSIKGIRKHFRGILGDDNVKHNVEIDYDHRKD